jgi:hypothetical protein
MFVGLVVQFKMIIIISLMNILEYLGTNINIMPIEIIKVELGPKSVIFTNINWIGENSRTRFSGFC